MTNFIKPRSAIAGLCARPTLAAVVTAALALSPGTFFAPSVVRAQPEDTEAQAGESRPLTPEELDEKSLPLRTALHQEPSLASPLDRLLDMYRQAGRLDELVGLYRDHVAAYPDDVNGTAVLVRLLAGTRDADALRVATAAARQFPDHAYLAYLRHEVLDGLNEPAALEQLDAAIGLEAQPARKRAWIERLLPMALAEDRLDLAEKHLRGLAATAGNSPELRLEAAREMIALKFHAAALELLVETAALRPAPETMVDIELSAAAAEVGVNRPADAASRLDRLLGKLTADYYRRPEIVRRRIALVVDETQRESMIARARQGVEARPKDEAAALELAQLLVGFEFRRDALEALLAAGKRLPASERVETETLALFDRLRDERGREEYLAARIERQPRRQDLKLLRVKSLYLLGRRADALSQFDGLLENLPDAERINQLLALGRYLRSSSQGSDAAEMFRRAVEQSPDRLDIRRELAEAYLAGGDRGRARELFAAGLPETAETEVLLDAVQFMIDQEMFVEARGVLAARLEKQPNDLEVRLLLLAVESRLGGDAAGAEQIATSRQLADTPARYRRWLEAAVAFHDSFDTAPAFLEEEQVRLDEELPVWNAARLERFNVLAEVSARNGRKEEIAAAIGGYLEEELPAAARVELSRRLIAILEKDPAQALAVEQRLQELTEVDPDRALEYRVRLALLHATAERLDLGLPLLNGLDVARINDAALLADLARLYGTQLGPQASLDIMERLVELAPANRASWEQLLQTLAALGDEARLRGVLRQLTAGVTDLPLADDTRDALRLHLADSYWRSIAALLAAGDDASAEEALVALDSVERAAAPRDGWQWILWTRAHLLNRLGRERARDEAIAELEQAVARQAEELAANDAAGDADAAAEPEAIDAEENVDDVADETQSSVPFAGIVFPDGVAVAWDQAVLLLTQSPREAEAAPAPARRGPLPKYRVAWAYDAPLGAEIHAVIPLEERRVLLCDTQGNLACLDAATGKALWTLDEPMETGAAGTSLAQQQQQVQQIVAMSAGSYPAAYTSAGWNQFAPQQMQYSGRVMQTSTPYGGYVPVTVNLPPALPPRPLSDGAGRILYGGGNRVTCLSSADGRLLWRADVSAGGAGVPGVPVCVFLHEDTVVAWAPAANTAAAFDRSSGKLRWETALPSNAETPLGWHNSGASLSEGRLLVYGNSAAVLDVATGAIVWSFDPRPVRTFPLRLEAPREEGASASAASNAQPAVQVPGGPAGSSPGTTGYAPQAVAANYVNHLQRGGTLPPPQQPGVQVRTGFAAPAAAWAANAGGSRLGVVAGDYLLLMDDVGLSVFSLELPLVSRRVELPGTFVGMAGNSACLLSAGNLHAVDLESGVVRSFALAEITGGNPAVRVQMTFDGNLAYVSSPLGVLGVNVRSGRKAFLGEWPRSLFAGDDPGADPAAGDAPSALTLQYLRPGAAEYDPNTGAAAPLPLLGAVGNGVLYARCGAGRVAALVEAAADGR